MGQHESRAFVETTACGAVDGAVKTVSKDISTGKHLLEDIRESCIEALEPTKQTERQTSGKLRVARKLS